jgi:hypothetical protein
MNRTRTPLAVEGGLPSQGYYSGKLLQAASVRGSGCSISRKLVNENSFWVSNGYHSSWKALRGILNRRVLTANSEEIGVRPVVVVMIRAPLRD